MILEKKPANINQSVIDWEWYCSAREALLTILKEKDLSSKTILAPAYIGYSTSEGSGVFDPILSNGNNYEFYHINENFQIDIKDIKAKMKKNKGSILLLIHYFGFVDREINEIKKYANDNEMIIVDDCAHAFFTFMNRTISNYDYAIFSVHKMFPFEKGGILIRKDSKKNSPENPELKYRYDLFRYNIQEIIDIRKRNYKYILKIINNKFSDFDMTVIFPELNYNVPQSFPLLLSNRKTRDHVYFQLNASNIGVFF